MCIRDSTYSEPNDPHDTLADYLIVSECSDIFSGEDASITALTTVDGYSKCERSWKYFKGEDDITPRDAAAVAALG